MALLELLFGGLIGMFAVCVVLLLSRLSEQDDAPREPRLPADLSGAETIAVDPFRNPDVLRERLEDLGRFNDRNGPTPGGPGGI